MKKIYCSHPFTGNEESNRLAARNKIAKLADKFSNTVFINPLDALMYAEDAGLDYDTCINQCIELLYMCDAMILFGDWQNSKGCIEEYRRASQKGIPVYNEDLTVLEF
jgi:hypothetical protein